MQCCKTFFKVRFLKLLLLINSNTILYCNHIALISLLKWKMYFIHICEPVSKGDAQKWDKCSENQMSELFITVYRLTMSGYCV